MTTSIRPFFTSAPRIKIYIGTNPIAYAVGFSLNVSVDVQPVYIIGQYAPVSLEPTLYNIVTGTMQIIRLKGATSVKTKGLGDKNGSLDSKRVSTNDSNGSEEIITGNGKNKSQISGRRELYSHLNPAELLFSSTFDVVLYIKVPTASALNTDSPPDRAGYKTIDTIETGGSATAEVKPWIKVVNCRITGRGTNMAIGQLINEPISFQGLLATPVSADNKELFKLDTSTSEA